MTKRKIINAIRDYKTEDFQSDCFWELSNSEMHDIIAEFDCTINSLCIDLAKERKCSSEEVLFEIYNQIADHLTEAWVEE